MSFRSGRVILCRRVAKEHRGRLSCRPACGSLFTGNHEKSGGNYTERRSADIADNIVHDRLYEVDIFIKCDRETGAANADRVSELSAHRVLFPVFDAIWQKSKFNHQKDRKPNPATIFNFTPTRFDFGPPAPAQRGLQAADSRDTQTNVHSEARDGMDPIPKGANDAKRSNGTYSIVFRTIESIGSSIRMSDKSDPTPVINLVARLPPPAPRPPP
ncbi:hypothetical protein EVAR_67291_1 [Eumeta japonica]|uniref:Uncharacterized protein n=1 Tax=Eumeta variegata TaxID=151549 RepID=A0A4C1ZVB7_EUMVA|nr:hypothetical protein EVAR_67291_1 [Eumeta japonica]